MQRIVLTTVKKRKLNKILNRHSTYKKFSATKIDAYEYTATLGVRVCPYCNIHFTYTVYETTNTNGVGGTHETPVCRPDIDHFEMQSKTGELSLAQDNLIPACQQCNSRVKFRKEFKKSTHLHPFYDDFDSIKRFSIDLMAPDFSKIKNFRITFSNRAVKWSPLCCQ